MPSPIAHAVTGLFIAEITRNSTDNTRLRIERGLYYSVIAIMPDLDFIPEIVLGIPFHHGMTHSIVFALIITLTMGGLYFLLKKVGVMRFVQLTFLTYTIHLVMDWFTASGAGIQLFWPFSEARARASTAVFPAVHHSRSPLDPIHIGFLTFEVIYSVLLWGWLYWHNQKFRA